MITVALALALTSAVHDPPLRARQAPKDLLVHFDFAPPSDPAAYFVPPISGTLVRGLIDGEPRFQNEPGGWSVELAGRERICLGERPELDFGAERDFGVEVWVSAIAPEPGRGRASIVSTRNGLDAESAGWALELEPDGAWSWRLGDGRSQWVYAPTAQRQSIADGRRHQLAFGVDRTRQTARLWRDGVQVAVFDLRGLGSVSAPGRSTVIGVDGTLGRSGAAHFEGKVYDFKIRPRPLSDDEVRGRWERETRERVPLAELEPGAPLRVLSWNLRILDVPREHALPLDWRGNADFVRAISASAADVVCLLGWGAKALAPLADGLGFRLHESGSRAVLSRFPIEETHPEHFGGVRLRLREDLAVDVCSLSLGSSPQRGAGGRPEERAAADSEGSATVRAFLAELANRPSSTAEYPQIVAGDFGGRSHVDSAVAAAGPAGLVSELMAENGFADAFREAHPDALAAPGLTWSDGVGAADGRVDFVYWRGGRLELLECEVLEDPAVIGGVHAPVLATFSVSSAR